MKEQMLACEVKGSGCPLVLLHAFPLSRAMWQGHLERLSGLGRVIAPDLPGFGDSPRQEVPSVAAMARSVMELLDALSAEEPAVVMGISMGGYVAFELFRLIPDRIRALVLVSTRAEADSEEQRRVRFNTEPKIRAEGMAALADGFLTRLLGKTTLNSRDDVREQVREMILDNDRNRDGIADSLLAMAARRDSSAILPYIRVPTLIVAGREDAVIPEDEIKEMALSIPNAQLRSIDEAGHLVNLERKDVFDQVCAEFLRGLGL